jgi:hypothetical protein
MELASLLRPLGLAAGPAAVLAFVVLIVGLVTTGEAELDTSPLAVASSVLLLVALFGIGATAVAALARGRGAGRGMPGAAIAVLGTVLVAGGGWASLFVLPGLAAEAPDVLESGLRSVIVGYIASYVVFTIGWVWTGVALVRAQLVPAWLGVLVAAGGALAFVPAPEAFRLLVIGVATSLVARRIAAPSAERIPETTAA